MHTLVLFAHPDPASLTASTARRIADGLVASGGTAEIADLAAEGFDPRYGDADLAVLRGAGGIPDDVLREQERVERADALVFVHPVYWWGMPALMKGWLDRVLTFGWAFGTDQATAIAERDVHLVRLGGNAPRPTTRTATARRSAPSSITACSSSPAAPSRPRTCCTPPRRDSRRASTRPSAPSCPTSDPPAPRPWSDRARRRAPPDREAPSRSSARTTPCGSTSGSRRCRG